MNPISPEEIYGENFADLKSVSFRSNDALARVILKRKCSEKNYFAILQSMERAEEIRNAMRKVKIWRWTGYWFSFKLGVLAAWALPTVFKLNLALSVAIGVVLFVASFKMAQFLCGKDDKSLSKGMQYLAPSLYEYQEAQDDANDLRELLDLDPAENCPNTIEFYAKRELIACAGIRTSLKLLCGEEGSVQYWRLKDICDFEDRLRALCERSMIPHLSVAGADRFASGLIFGSAN